MSSSLTPADIDELREIRTKALQRSNKNSHGSSVHADNQHRRQSSKKLFDARYQHRGRQQWRRRPLVQGFVPDDDSDRELSPESQRCPERAKLTRQEKAFSDFKASSYPKCFCGEKAHKVTTKGYGGGAFYQCHNMGKDRSKIAPSSTYSYLANTRRLQPSHCQFTACDMHQQPLDGKPPTFPPSGIKPVVVVGENHHAAKSNALEICHFHLHHDAWELCKRQIDSIVSVLDNGIITSCPWSNYTFLVLFRVDNRACAVPATPDTIQCSCNNELRFRYDLDIEEWVWECKDIFNPGVKPKCAFSQAANQTRMEVPSDWFPHESLCKGVAKVDKDHFKTAYSTQPARDDVSSATLQDKGSAVHGLTTRNRPYRSSRDADDAFLKFEIGRLRSRLKYAIYHPSTQSNGDPTTVIGQPLVKVSKTSADRCIRNSADEHIPFSSGNPTPPATPEFVSEDHFPSMQDSGNGAALSDHAQESAAHYHEPDTQQSACKSAESGQSTASEYQAYQGIVQIAQQVGSGLNARHISPRFVVFLQKWAHLFTELAQIAEEPARDTTACNEMLNDLTKALAGMLASGDLKMQFSRCSHSQPQGASPRLIKSPDVDGMPIKLRIAYVLQNLAQTLLPTGFQGFAAKNGNCKDPQVNTSVTGTDLGKQLACSTGLDIAQAGGHVRLQFENISSHQSVPPVSATMMYPAEQVHQISWQSHILEVENVLTHASGDTCDQLAKRLLENANKRDSLAEENAKMRAELQELRDINKAQEERIDELEQQVVWTEVAGNQRLRAQRHDALMKRDKRLPSGKTERCRVCEVGEIEVAFEGCWHMATCEGCASNCDRCPICRRWKTTIRQVYYG